jgi:hypothetical protein
VARHASHSTMGTQTMPRSPCQFCNDTAYPPLFL